jgi:hypothetical protein
MMGKPLAGDGADSVLHLALLINCNDMACRINDDCLSCLTRGVKRVAYNGKSYSNKFGSVPSSCP